MQQFNLQRIVCALLLACGIASWAAQVAVPTPRPYTSRLPANIVGEVYRTVCDGVAGAGFSVLSEGASNELLKSIETQDRTAQTTILQEKGIAGLLRAELNRGLGGFVLHVEPMACQSGLGLPTEPFDIQIGQYQNLRRCVAELTAMLNSGKVGNQAPMTALLAPRIQEPLAPLYLGNYLSGRLESGLLQRGYRLCAPAVLEQALRQNRLGGCFELTQERCLALGKTLQVASFIQIIIDTYQVYANEGSTGLCARITGIVREVSAVTGELVQSVPIQLEVASTDVRLTQVSIQDVNAFGQAALDLVVQEQILPHWPRRR